MDLKNHCLFCLEQIAPYCIPSLSSSSVSSSCVEGGGGNVGESVDNIPTFQSLCSYLKISLPKDENEEATRKRKGKYLGKLSLLPSTWTSTCDKFLCIWCFEMVDQLSKLYREMGELQMKIEEMTGRIRGVVISHDISANLSSSNRRRREEFEQKVWGSIQCESRGNHDCLTFVEMFQSWVQRTNDKLNNDSNIEKDDRKPSSRSTNKKRTRISKTENTATSEEVTTQVKLDSTEVDAGELKIEVTEEDLNKVVEEERFSDDFNAFSPGPGTPYQSENSLGIISHSIAGKEGSKEEEEWRPPNEVDADKRKTRKASRIKSKKTCRKIKTARQTSTKTRSSRSSNKPLKFKCPDCDLSFSSYFTRWAHRTKQHPQDTSIVDNLDIPTLTINKPPGVRNRIRIKVCTICGLHVKEYSGKLLKYMEHMLSHDDTAAPEESGLHSCDECEKTFVLKINLNLHKACIHDSHQVLIKCDYCTEYTLFKTREELIEHLKALHGETVHSCKHCPMSFTSLDKLLAHMGKHKGCKRLLCPECDLGIFGTMKELRQHCHDCHPNLVTTYSCEFCDKYFFIITSLQKHLEYAHNYNSALKTISEPAVFQCEQCNNGKVFKTKLTLEQHIKYTHSGVKKVKCKECEETFLYKSKLREHVQKCHEKIRYPCPHCPKSYGDQKQLDFHLKTHTGEGLFTCHMCSKQFPRMNQLNVHMRTHEVLGPEDKRMCDICGKEFLGEFRLLKHKRDTHSGKKHECSVCGIKMKRSEHVRSHMRIHTGERPYVCMVCSKGFNRRDILRVHVKGVHGLELSEIEAQQKADVDNL